MNISDRIKRYRKACGLSQEQLADAIGVSPLAVSNWEVDEEKPDFGNLIALSRVFGISTDSLLIGIESRAPDSVVASIDSSAIAPDVMDVDEEPEISEDEELGQISLEFVPPEIEQFEQRRPVPTNKKSKANVALVAGVVGVIAVIGGILAVVRHRSD